MRRTFSLVAGLLAVALLVSGCSGGVDGPVVDGDRRTSGEDATVVGEVLVEGECLYLVQGETRYPVIWPHGTRWDATESAVALPGGTLAYQGDEVSGGGGYHHEENLAEYTSQEGVELIMSCVDNDWGEIAVFNSGGPVEIFP